MTKTTGKKKSETIKAALAVVRFTARCGRFPIVSDDVEWINPTTKRVVPGVALEFGDNGQVELDPVHDAALIKATREFLAEGRDERIALVGLMEVAGDNLLPPFPKWDVTAADEIPKMVEALGLDAELCLRYELQRGGEARAKVVKALEVKVDAPPVEDPMSEPSLD